MVLGDPDAGKMLSAAAARGDLLGVRRMLQKGVHPDTPNEFGRTALQVMMMGSSAVARELLERGAEPNVRDRLGITPAHDAARTGFLDTLRVLVQFGAAVNVPDRSGELPLHVAIREGHADVAGFLAPLSNLWHHETCGETALGSARHRCRPDVVQLSERRLASSLTFRSDLVAS
uniref:Cyclin-dependent kinase 4 inhibitor D n=2 Tax=Lepisosteus oculatus TaxID=7918 RepID=W5MM23_LEPOC